MTNDLLAALLAERYGPSHWWTAPDEQPDDDSDTAQARRRRQMVRDFERSYEREVG